MAAWRRRAATIALVVVAVIVVAAFAAAPTIAAGGLLHPARHKTTAAAPTGCVERDLAGQDVTLRGWTCTVPSPRGTIVYLHGVADNRGSAAGAIGRFTAQRLNVIAYDSRAHGDSGGDICTYGYFEKEDLRRVIDAATARPVLLVGTSLGAAVALQTAAIDDRIAGVVAAEVFSDLRTVARERAPRILTDGIIESAFGIAEARGRFRIDDVSPRAAAARITVPVLLIHGADDVETPPRHSQLVMAALAGPKELLLVPGAGHNQSLHSPDTWRAVERFLAARLTPH